MGGIAVGAAGGTCVAVGCGVFGKEVGTLEGVCEAAGGLEVFVGREVGVYEGTVVAVLIGLWGFGRSCSVAVAVAVAMTVAVGYTVGTVGLVVSV